MQARFALQKGLRKLIATNAPDTEMRALAEEEGLVTLRGAALNKLKAGITTVSEVLAVTSATK